MGRRGGLKVPVSRHDGEQGSNWWLTAVLRGEAVPRCVRKLGQRRAWTDLDMAPAAPHGKPR